MINTDKTILNISNSVQFPLFPPENLPEIPEVQESTMQVPCGPYSIFDLSCHSLHEFDRAVYWVINEYSYWDTGVSHALSYNRLAELLNVACSSQVKRAVRHLIDAGFLKIRGRRKSDRTNIYNVIHHKCPPDQVPLDEDGRPQKCAVPRGKGSGSALLADSKISWREFVQWMINKISSDWSSGEVAMTIDKASQLLRFCRQTICDNFRKLRKVCLLQRLSSKFRAGIYRILPKPYPKRKERAAYKGKKPLKLKGDWYYSHNRRWCFHKDNFHVLMKDGDKWRDSSMHELSKINAAIHRDFSEYMSLYASEEFGMMKSALSTT